MIDNDIKALKQDKFKKCIHKYKDKLDKINFQSGSLAIKSKDPSFVFSSPRDTDIPIILLANLVRAKESQNLHR